MEPFFDIKMYILIIVQFIIGIFGIFLNSSVVYITIKYKQLRKFSGYLLGGICFYDAVYGTNGLVPFVTMSAQFQIPLSICFFFQCPATFIVDNSIVLMFLLALERLLAVLFPIWHQSKTRRSKNAIAILIASFAGNLIIFYFFYDYISSNEMIQKPVYCLPSDTYKGSAAIFASNLALTFNALTLAVYVLLFISIKCKKLNNVEANQRITKSIFVLITINLCLWSTSILFGSMLIPNSTLLNDDMKIFLPRVFSQFNRLATALNAPVLYFCSSEYRTSFRKEFKFIGRQS